MYNIKKVNPADLEKIQVRQQYKIQELTGSQLNPSKAYELIRKESAGFSEENLKAMEADLLFAELLKREKIALKGEARVKEKKEYKTKPKNKKGDQHRIRIREQERSRSIEILELELQMAA